ncbi:MAG TPA: apolipoprotein N-acyltransferase [Usitatibacter sp.]|nr:apolipoprotein N-acyltransferase [Usitatibacter sp.]
MIRAVPAIAGAACVFGFAPFYAWPVPIVALAVLFTAWERSSSPRRAALAGFAFGLGYFLAGVSWVYVSLHDFGSMPAPLAALATFLFCAFLAIFPALAGWLARRYAARNPASLLALSAAAFTLCEWLRGWLFSGFPWLTVGTSQVPGGPLAGFAPIAGMYGVSLMVCLVAATLAAAARSFEARGARWRVVAVAAAILAAGGALRWIDWGSPAGPPVRMALLQGNVAQELKWREEIRTRTLVEYRQMILDAQARVVVLPETALPAFFDQLPEDYLASIRDGARAAGKDVLMGIVEREFRAGEYDYYNTLLRLTGPRQAYRKRHLVPFGEYIPPGFKFVLAVLKIPLSDFASGGADQAPLEAGGVSFAVAICYEDIFGEELIGALPRAQALVNVSNDAWFGESFAADQHLQASQARALESSRWMVRATNTGATAAIDEKGRVVARLAPFTAGTLIADVTPRKGQTPYVLFGNLLAIACALVLAAIAWNIGRRPEPQQ